MATAQIGDIIDIYCPRCRLNLDGSVAAVDGATVLKVTCRTCGNESKYKPAVDMEAKKKKQLERLMKMRDKKMRGPEVSAPVQTNALRALWDELTDKVDARYAKVYDPSRTYKAEDAILHKQHGMGIVHDVHGDGEMNVLFRTGFHRIPSGVEPEED